MVKKEQSAKYDAGIAIDDVALIDCPLKRPTESDCPVDEWKCENQVLTNITYQIGIQNISFFSVVKIVSCFELSNQCCQLSLFSTLQFFGPEVAISFYQSWQHCL